MKSITSSYFVSTLQMILAYICCLMVKMSATLAFSLAEAASACEIELAYICRLVAKPVIVSSFKLVRGEMWRSL